MTNNDELRIEEHHPSAPVTPQRSGTPHSQPAAVPVVAPPAETAADAEASAPTPARWRLFAQMKAEDRSWVWKFIVRCIVCVVDIIAIAGIGAILSAGQRLTSNPFIGIYEDAEAFPYCIIAFGVSFVWCLVCVLVRLFRRPPRPVHPGLEVGIDLVIWLSFIIVVLVGVAAVLSVNDFGNDPDYLSDPGMYHHNYSGHYELASNGTWVYVIDSSTYSPDPVWNSTSGTYYYPPETNSTVVRDCTDLFDTCAEQDAYVNALWAARSTRHALDLLVTVCAGLALCLHVALFVQACIDTHKHRQKRQLDMVSTVLADMEQRGLITFNGDAARPGQQPMTEKTVLPPPPVRTAARYA